MAGGDGKLSKGAEELGTYGNYLEQGRGRQESVGKLLQGGGTVGSTVWGGDVGDDPTYIAGAGELHARGRAQDHRE